MVGSTRGPIPLRAIGSAARRTSVVFGRIALHRVPAHPLGLCGPDSHCCAAQIWHRCARIGGRARAFGHASTVGSSGAWGGVVWPLLVRGHIRGRHAGWPAGGEPVWRTGQSVGHCLGDAGAAGSASGRFPGWRHRPVDDGNDLRAGVDIADCHHLLPCFWRVGGFGLFATPLRVD